MTHLRVSNLNKEFGNQTVIKNLSFSFEKKVLGIAGANGSGKSTLLKLLSGLLKPSSGEINWLIDDIIYDAKSVKTQLGFAAPSVQLYDELTSKENLKFLKSLHQNGKTDTESISALLQLFEASHLADKFYGELSTGQQQRIKLASACINNPTVICLDEPGTNLDAAGLETLRMFIDRSKKNGKMILLASNQEQELHMCEEVLNLSI